MFVVMVASEARLDLSWFPKAQQVAILATIAEQLQHQPEVATRNRKRMRPGHLTEWELRIGDIRVFYDLDLEASVVNIAAIGYKERNRLFFRGEEYRT